MYNIVMINGLQGRSQPIGPTDFIAYLLHLRIDAPRPPRSSPHRPIVWADNFITTWLSPWFEPRYEVEPVYKVTSEPAESINSSRGQFTVKVTTDYKTILGNIVFVIQMSSQLEQGAFHVMKVISG